MSINTDVIEETTKITIIKDATSTNSLKISANELLFNEKIDNTITEKLKISQTQLTIKNGSSLYSKLDGDSIIFCDKTTYNETILTTLTNEKLQIKNKDNLSSSVEINSSTIKLNDGFLLSKDGLTSTSSFDLNIQELKVNGENHNASINQVLGVNSSGTLVFKELTIGNTIEENGPELTLKNMVLPVLINGNTYYIQLFTKPPL